MMDIQENMEVVDANGQRVGFVEHVKDGFIQLKSRDILDPRQRSLHLDQVDTVEDNKVKLFQQVSAVTTRAFLSSDK